MGTFVRFVVYKLAEYWLTHGGLGQFSDSQGPVDIDIRKTTLVFNRPTESPGSTRDIVETSAYWALTADGVFSGAWDDTELEAVETAITTWWTAMKAHYPTTTTFVEIRWYLAGSEVVDPNPVFRVTPVNVAGTNATSMLPPQVSTTLTLQTASRRHWGRMFLPSPVVGLIDGTTANGRWLHTFVDDVVEFWVAQMAALLLDGVLQVVWSPAAQSILGITAFSSDDVPDTQRRRRFATVGYRHVVNS